MSLHRTKNASLLCVVSQEHPNLKTTGLWKDIAIDQLTLDAASKIGEAELTSNWLVNSTGSHNKNLQSHNRLASDKKSVIKYIIKKKNVFFYDLPDVVAPPDAFLPSLLENPTTAPRLGTYASGHRCAAWQCCGDYARVCCIFVLVSDIK